MKSENASPASHTLNHEVMVSIVCITYNQEAYIAQALESFVAQSTTFPIEIIVHDDASTDKTADILRSYEKKYPKRFVCIYQKLNQYSKGVHIWADITFPKARGKYIALCEGDDYWTDPYKLQKQVDILEADKSLSMCFHNAKIRYEDKSHEDKLFCSGFDDRQIFTIKDLILRNWFCPTASILFRKSNMPVFPDWAKKRYNWDLTLQYLISASGDFIYLNEEMSVYRKNAVNSLSSIDRNVTFFNNNLIALLRSVNKYTNYKYAHIIFYRILRFRITNIKNIYRKYKAAAYIGKQ